MLASSFASYAQAPERCSTTRNEARRKAARPGRETAEQFEMWMKDRLASAPQITSATYTIPVVVHVLHNGTSDITNISDAQILSQIDVLNKDFKRLNLDAVNTPSPFNLVAGSIDMDFILAQRDPEGLATTGITRTLATKPQWSLADQSEFKALSYWPAEDYLNIWVVSFGTNDIGFAQFPVSNSLAGLEMASEDRLTDGIVVDYRAFGTSDAGSFPLMANFNKGRTATHEIGHFFGLRHIWGDVSSCGDNDFVPDTPPQSSATSLCPSHPQVSCSNNKMFMNYMDYTNDACMNLFTAGQVARMLVVLGESPRRASLLTSLGATPPVMALNDLGIREVLAPAQATCLTSIQPQVELRNYGTNTITSTIVQLNVSGPGGTTANVPLTVNLGPGQSTTHVFNPVAVSAGGSYTVTFSILETNGGPDGNTQNDQTSQPLAVAGITSLPISQNFTTLPPDWTVDNPDNQIGWTNVLAPDNSPSNRAMRLNFYDYEIPGLLDGLISPAFTLSTPQSAQLKFDIAYAAFPGQEEDALRVYALPGCNPDLTQAVLLYDKASSALATTSPTSNSFTPTNENQWRKSEILSLSGLSSSIPWQVAFVGRNGYGNNLFLDNAVVTEDEINDIAFAGVVSPGIVHCDPDPVVQFKVTNLGTSPVNQFTVMSSVNGTARPSQVISNIQLDVGETETFSLNPVTLVPGQNEIELDVSMPNGIPDILTNNTYTLISVLDLTGDRAPLRLTFDNPKETSWRIASPSNGLPWQSFETNKEQSVGYRSYTNPSLGAESWLVSPILDLSSGAFSMFFDISYAQNMPADDWLRVVASRDCGVTYDDILLDRAASTFTSASSSSEWYPGNNDDWRREYLDLSTLANLNNIRLAFVVRNDNGNNLFLDNVELFAGDDTNPPTTTAPFQFYYSSRNSQSDVALTLNLSSRQDVTLQILGLQGNLVSEHLLTDALNQTYYFDLSQQAEGLYLFRLLIDQSPSVTKVFIGH
jgi:hypothetical protein